MIKNVQIWTFTLTILIWLSACTNDNNLLTHPTPTVAIHATETSVPTPLLASTEQKSTIVQPIQKVSDSTVFNTWWSPDSSNLFYTIDEGTFAYNLLKEMSTNIDNPSHISSNSGLDSLIPPEAHAISFAPSGIQILYLKFISIPATSTPAISMRDAGESDLGEIIAELWLLNSEGVRLIGEMEYCGIENYFWSKDEQDIVIVAATLPASCSQAYAWHVNLEDNTLQPLFSKESTHGIVPIYNISPDGTSLLYGISGNNDDGSNINSLFILDLDTLTSASLGTPMFSKGIGWLDNQTVLIEYKEQLESSLTLGFFDLTKSELVNITPQFEGLWIRFVKLSPDNQWISFATGEDFYHMHDLWVAEISKLQ